MKTERLVKGRGANLLSQHNSVSHWVDLLRFENIRIYLPMTMNGLM